MSDEWVEWHTWSGRLHKFGPLIPRRVSYGEDYRVALCSRSIVSTARDQRVRPQKTICKRCFPECVA